MMAVESKAALCWTFFYLHTLWVERLILWSRLVFSEKDLMQFPFHFFLNSYPRSHIFLGMFSLLCYHLDYLPSYDCLSPCLHCGLLADKLSPIWKQLHKRHTKAHGNGARTLALYPMHYSDLNIVAHPISTLSATILMCQHINTLVNAGCKQEGNVCLWASEPLVRCNLFYPGPGDPSSPHWGWVYGCGEGNVNAFGSPGPGLRSTGSEKM